MQLTGLNKITVFLIMFGFIALILVPLYVVFYLFVLYFFTLIGSIYLIALMPLVLFGLYLLFVALFIFESKFIIKIFNKNIKEGHFKSNELNYSVFLFSMNVILPEMTFSLLDKLIIPKAFISELVFFLFGAKMGKNVHISCPIIDPMFVEIGDNTLIGKQTLISGHFMVGKEIFLKKTKIGKNVTIGAGSIVGPGTTIQDGVIVGANSFVKQNSVLKKNSLYAGSPVKFIKKL